LSSATNIIAVPPSFVLPTGAFEPNVSMGRGIGHPPMG
jgi:hypothetical protein